ncbi:hypothetical protein [Photobacterium halotolerans]|uniref:Uncharacterized protein n=1 Tax=Photobacterium halotolerans TaxID=265726 RepID=A0A7X5AR65_9GAMM|nr:hypothetical protein [Photobacterium halotolerans]NAW63978.1 hypothetical protein [Photobacterium halotolerans]
MRIEKLIGKFGLKGIHYAPSTGGRALLTVEEQLAIVGLQWRVSPAGWLLLFEEVQSDEVSRKQLIQILMGEANRLMVNWRGTYPDKALIALAVTAIAECSQQFGAICPECNGTGYTKNKRRITRKCPACKDGRVPWTNETRFAKFAQVLPVPFSRFNRYKPILEELVRWLNDGRTAALLSVQQQIELEEREARKVA